MTTTTRTSLCDACALRFTAPLGDDACPAYPGGIPDEIVYGGTHLRLRGDEVEPVAFTLRSEALFRRWYRARRAAGVAGVKHGGPGPHSTGTPQLAHGGGRGSAGLPDAELVYELADVPGVTYRESDATLFALASALNVARFDAHDLPPAETLTVTPGETEVVTTQRNVIGERVRALATDTRETSGRPALIRLDDGRLLLANGHHRWVAAAAEPQRFDVDVYDAADVRELETYLHERGAATGDAGAPLWKARPGKRPKPPKPTTMEGEEAVHVHIRAMLNDTAWLGPYAEHLEIDRTHDDTDVIETRVGDAYYTRGSVTAMKEALEASEADGLLRMDRSSTSFAYAFTHRLDDLLGHAPPGTPTPRPEPAAGLTFTPRLGPDGELVSLRAGGAVPEGFSAVAFFGREPFVEVTPDRARPLVTTADWIENEVSAARRAFDLDLIDADERDRRLARVVDRERIYPSERYESLDARLLRVSHEGEGDPVPWARGEIERHAAKAGGETWFADPRWRQNYTLDEQLRAELDPGELATYDDALARLRAGTLTRERFTALTGFTAPDDDDLWLLELASGELPARERARVRSVRVSTGVAWVAGAGAGRTRATAWAADREAALRWAERFVGLAPYPDADPDDRDAGWEPRQGGKARRLRVVDGTEYWIQTYDDRVLVREVASGEGIGMGRERLTLPFADPEGPDEGLIGVDQRSARRIAAGFVEELVAGLGHTPVVADDPTRVDVTLDPEALARVTAELDRGIESGYRLGLYKNTKRETRDKLARILTAHRGDFPAVKTAVEAMFEAGELKRRKDRGITQTLHNLHSLGTEVDEDERKQMEKLLRTVETRLEAGLTLQTNLQLLALDAAYSGVDAALEHWREELGELDLEAVVAELEHVRTLRLPDPYAIEAALLRADAFETWPSYLAHNVFERLAALVDDPERMARSIEKHVFPHYDVKPREGVTPRDVAERLIAGLEALSDPYGEAKLTPYDPARRAELDAFLEQLPETYRGNVARVAERTFGMVVPRLVVTAHTARSGRRVDVFPGKDMALAPAVREELETSYHALAADYPSLALALKAVSDVSTSARAYAAYYEWNQEIRFPRGRWGTQKQYRNQLISLAGDEASLFHPKGTGNVNGVFAHEFAHHIYHHLEPEQHGALHETLRRYLRAAAPRIAWETRYADDADERYAPWARRRLRDLARPEMTTPWFEPPRLPEKFKVGDHVRLTGGEYTELPEFEYGTVTAILADGSIRVDYPRRMLPRPGERSPGAFERRVVVDPVNPRPSMSGETVRIAAWRGASPPEPPPAPDVDALISDLVEGRTTADYPKPKFWLQNDVYFDDIAQVLVKLELSEYALKDDNEFTAEAFSEYRLRGADARPLARIVGTYLDHLFKGL